MQRRATGPEGNWLSQNASSRRVAFPYRDAHSYGVNASSPSRRHDQPLIVVCTILLLAAFIGACGGAGTERRATTQKSAVSHTSHAATASTSAPVSRTRDDAQVVAAVRAYWATYLELAGRPGPFDASTARASLAPAATGAALDRLLSVLRTNAAAGYVVRGSIESRPRVVSRLGSSATVRDCYDDHSGLFQIADGVRIDQDDPLPHLATIGLELQPDGWKVSSVDQPEEPCASS